MCLHLPVGLNANVLQVFKIWVWMGSWGASTAKATYLYSNDEAAIRIFGTRGRPGKQQNQLANQYIDSAGRRRVSGNKNLKLSQSNSELSHECLQTVVFNIAA